MSVKVKQFVPFMLALGAILLLPFLINQARADGAQLPGGAAIEVNIENPAGDTAVSLTTADTLTLSGSVTVGAANQEADTTLIYVLDASGSTEDSAGINLFCPDQNPADQDPGDPVPDENEVIDCEIAAAIALNEQAAALGTVDEVAAIMFAGAAVTADATPDAADQPLVTPGADANGNHVPDMHETLQSIQVAFFFGHASGFSQFQQKSTPDIIKTDYADALREVERVAAQSSNSHIVVVFVSDGVNNAGTHINQALPIMLPGKQVTFHTFAIPDAASYGGTCSSDRDKLGSLQEIVDLQNEANSSENGRCYNVSDPSDLPAILPQVMRPSLDTLQLQIDGSAATPFPHHDVSTALPQPGPTTVTFETAVADLSAGEHQLCVTATGSDPQGSSSASDCITVLVEGSAPSFDFGDAPGPYPTQAGDNGASHQDFSMEWLGFAADAEADANADDADDGVIYLQNNYPAWRLFANVTTSGLGAARYGSAPEQRLYLQLWLDYNQDGDWDDAGEEVVTCDMAPGTRTVCNGRPMFYWRAELAQNRIPINLRTHVPKDAGPTWLRARLSYGAPVGPTGPASFGEVEDYEINLFTRH